MNGHPQFDDDFDLYALGVLEPEEKLAIESHVKDCASCMKKLAEARGRIALLAATVPSVNTPAHVKQRLMARVRAANATEQVAKSNSWLAALWRQPAAAWAIALIALISALGLAFNNYRLEQKIRALQADSEAQQITVARARSVLELLTGPGTQRVTLIVASEKPHPEGRVYYKPNSGMLFYAANLPAPPAEHIYQLWLIPTEGAPVSAGIFAPDSKGNASIVLPDLPSGTIAKAFAITIEPEGGVSQPTGPKVLIGVS